MNYPSSMGRHWNGKMEGSIVQAIKDVRNVLADQGIRFAGLKITKEFIEEVLENESFYGRHLKRR